MDKEGESPQMTSNPLHRPLEQAVIWEEVVVNPLEEDVQVDRHGHQEDP